MRFGFIFIIAVLPFLKAQARPQYALKHGIVSCTACHVSATGGGIRNENGKLYGAHTWATNANHQRAWYQVDYRALAYYTERATKESVGVGLMSLLGSINVPVFEDSHSRTNFVASYNFGSFATNIQEAYIRNEFKDQGLVEHVQFGLMAQPFGVMSDEHRTYVRIQSNTQWTNTKMGAMVSGHLFKNTHFDLAAYQGYQKAQQEGPGQFQTGPVYSLLGNFRWMPSQLPLMFGTSASVNQRHSDLTNPYAISLYSGLSLDRLTKGRFPSQILVEYVEAKYWNDKAINLDFGREIVTPDDSAYLTALKNKTSQGIAAWWFYDVSPKFTLVYKYDWLRPAKDYAGDYFDRHGVGFRYVSSANMQWWVRYEQASVGRSNLNVYAPFAQNAGWAVLHYWF